MNFNLETNVNNMAYIKYMEEQQKKENIQRENDNGKQNKAWRTDEPRTSRFSK